MQNEVPEHSPVIEQEMKAMFEQGLLEWSLLTDMVYKATAFVKLQVQPDGSCSSGQFGDIASSYYWKALQL